MEFPRAKRDGETKEEYACALQEFLELCISREFPEETQPPGPSSSQSLLGGHLASQPKARPAATPSLIGAIPTTQLKLREYKKTSGAADGAGENFEWKMLTLIFLRMLAAGYEFLLSSNMEAAGLFDDIVVRYRKHCNDPWKAACLQLKHKQKKNVSNSALLGLSGDFSLVKYCGSFMSAKESVEKEFQPLNDLQFIIFTNACIDDSLGNEVETVKLFDTGGKAVSFEFEVNLYQALCEWVEIKKTLIELQSELDGRSGEEVRVRVKEVVESIECQNKVVESCRDDLLKTPTSEKLVEWLKKLEIVGDVAAFSLFLTEFQVYTNQAQESELDSKIQEELSKVWIRSDKGETSVMFYELLSRVKVWWQKDKYYLTQDWPEWLNIIKSQTEMLSKSSIDGLTKSGAVFVESCLKALYALISRDGIVNVRVDSRTAASSLKVLQALAKFGSPDLCVLHVNMQALMEREDDILAAWATRWCRVLVIECDVKLDQKHASRISAKILKVLGRKIKNKRLILIASKRHELNLQLYIAKCYKSFNDNFVWNFLTEKSKANLLSNKVVINGTPAPLPLSALVGRDESFVEKADLEVTSQLLTGDLSCGKELDEVGKFFVTRRLKDPADDIPFVVNSVSDVTGKVVLLVAEPGMGKTTLVTQLAKSAKKEDPNAWIVHIKLNDCVQYLAEIDTEYFNEVTAKTFLEHAALNPRNCLEKLLFWSLKQKHVVFVDGVDEVCPYYEQQVFTLLSFLKDMRFSKLWVASRPVFLSKLEDTFQVKTLRLVAFSEEDQKEFFQKVWRDKNPFATPEKCKEVTRSLFIWLTKSLGDDNPVLGVPLMTAMIAETFIKQKFPQNSATDEFNNDERLNIMKLYKTFVTMKFKLYCVEKKKTHGREAANIKDESTLMKQMHHNHCLAALRTLFSCREIVHLRFEGKKRFKIHLCTFLKEVSDGREMMGIIDNVIDGIPQFIHRSFAEYFAASWLASNFKKNKSFIKRIIFNPAFMLVSEMFHHALVEGHPLHAAVFSRDVETTLRILTARPVMYDIDAVDDGGRTPLHLAVLLNGTDQHPNCIRILQYLIFEHKARIDIADDVLHWGPLRYAEWSGAWASLHIMLKSRENYMEGRRNFFLKNNRWLNAFFKQNNWPKPNPRVMLDGARDASVLVVRYLADERHGKLKCRGPQGESMIHSAAERGNIEILEYLSSKGLPLNLKDNENNTALHYASPEALTYLLEHGLDLEDVNLQGLTTLQVAAQNGEYALMINLLEVNAIFQVRPGSEASTVQLNTSLLCAAFAGRLEYVQNLVEMGAFINYRDKKGHTAAWHAMYQKHIEVMDWLLLHGSEAGDKPLHAACRKGESAIVAFIMSRNTEVDVKGWREQSPLIAAAWAGHIDVVMILLEKEASVEFRDDNGWTSLHCASSRGHEEVATLLIRGGADVEVKNDKGLTPLHLATANNRVAVVGLLLENGASVTSCDGVGRTPLHTASVLGYEGIVDMLLRHGAEVRAKDTEGRTALNLATKLRHSRVVTVLKASGAVI